MTATGGGWGNWETLYVLALLASWVVWWRLERWGERRRDRLNDERLAKFRQKPGNNG
jgi:hypothetical protein